MDAKKYFRITARDRAIGRLRRLTILATAAGAALTGAFAGLAAHAAPGRSTSRGPTSQSTSSVTRHRTSSKKSSSSSSSATQSQPSPTPPASAPTPSYSAPVVSSGGS